MHSRIPCTLFVVGLAILVAGPTLSAKPDLTPVRLEYSIPARVKTGDEVTTTITLRALDDIERLEVSLLAFRGLEIVSDQRDAVFTAIPKGGGPQMTVTVRVTGENDGVLTLNYTTRRGTTTSGGSKSIAYVTGN